jgi:GT2 family glycosyltransferase
MGAEGGAGAGEQLPVSVVSVVVVNYNGGTEVEDTLAALAADDASPAFEVLVVDNASTDASAEIAERFAAGDERFTVVRSPVNRGYAGGVNVGLERARGRYIAVINMDIHVSPGWLRPLVDELDARPATGVACPLVLLRADQDRLNSAGQDVNVTGLGFNRLLGKPRDAAGTEPEQVSGLHGAAFVIRREILDRLGGWDESGFLYSEDVQLSWETQLIGSDIRVIPRSTVTHDYHLSMDPEKLFLLERNRAVIVLSHERLGTLALLSPLFALTELMMWGYCLIRGPRFLAAKGRTYGWLARHLGWVRGRRARSRELRRRSDRDMLGRLRWGYAWDQFVTLGRERGLESRREIPSQSAAD